jgi:hypothetical protein
VTAPEPLAPFARRLGFRPGGQLLTYDRLLDLCVDAYWQRRRPVHAACGSEPGYRRHLAVGEPTCAPCRAAHATVVAIRRRRRQRGALAPVLQLRPCGTHAAFVRHKARGEKPCAACEAGETAYQQQRHRTRRQAS